jgi:hypothetical protein
MTKRYHTSYCYNDPFFNGKIYDIILNYHPLIWQAENGCGTVLIAWNEIPKEMEDQVAELEKERGRLVSERIDRRLRNL